RELLRVRDLPSTPSECLAQVSCPGHGDLDSSSWNPKTSGSSSPNDGDTRPLRRTKTGLRPKHQAAQLATTLSTLERVHPRQMPATNEGGWAFAHPPIVAFRTRFPQRSLTRGWSSC